MHRWPGPGYWRVGERAGQGSTARGAGAAPFTYRQARHPCCSYCAQRSPVVKLEGHVRWGSLELDHVDHKSYRSVACDPRRRDPWTFCGACRPTPRHTQARRAMHECRLLFTVGVRHVWELGCAAVLAPFSGVRSYMLRNSLPIYMNALIYIQQEI